MINYKKVLAGALATSMVMGNSLIVFAADQTGNTSGDGSFEGTADVPDVFKVTLPTVTSGTFDYIADPEGLASGSAADKYSGAAFDTGSLFFKTTNPDDNSIKYSSTSEKIEVVNKSSIAVDIDVKATVTPVAGINLSESNTFATDDKSTSIYLELTDGTEKGVLSNTEEAAISKNIPGAPTAYETKWNSTTSKYEKKEKATIPTDAYDNSKYEFYLTGVSNANGDWSDASLLPSIDLVWTVEDPTLAPSVTMTPAGLITASNFTSEQNYSYMTLTDSVGSVTALDEGAGTWDWTGYDNGVVTLTLSDGWMSYLAGSTVKITLYLTDDTTKSVTVAIPEATTP